MISPTHPNLGNHPPAEGSSPQPEEQPILERETDALPEEPEDDLPTIPNPD